MSTIEEYQAKMGWRLRSGWLRGALNCGYNPMPVVCQRSMNLDYWHLHDGYGHGDLIFYNIRVRDAYRLQGRAYPWFYS